MANSRVPQRIRLALVSMIAVTLVAGCGSDDDSTVAGTVPAAGAPAASPDTNSDTTTLAPAGAGTIDVRLEDVDGIFIEGFEVGLRFETTDGEVIDSTLWSDFVNARGDPDLSAYYDSVLEQPVPSGQVVVFASVNVGIGPPPEIPDIDGELRCRLLVDVPADGSVDVVVTFSSDDDCLRLG